MKKFLLLLSVVGILSANEYQEWLKQQNQEFTTYKKTMDEEFSNMLKKDWEAFKSMYSTSPYKEPKPKKMPEVKKEIVIPKKEIKASPIVKIKPIKKEIIKPKPIKVKKILKDDKYKNIKFDFYSQNIEINYDKNILFRVGKIDKDSISSFWEKISKTEYKKLIKQIENYSKNFSLNDWGKYQFINKIGAQIYKDENGANLFSWFILVKMGYDTKIGYNSNSTYILSTLIHKLYQMPFFKLNKKTYYVMVKDGRSKGIGKIFTYKGEYPKAKKMLSFEINEDIKFYTNLDKKELKFKFDGKEYIVEGVYSKDLIEFYKSFPQSDYRVYFSTKNSTPLMNSILKSLSKIVEGKSQLEAVNILLRFTQTAFKYKTDQNQFDYEKVMFPEETVSYPYSDCEDRSIMFSFLVKNILNLEVVGLKYPDHLATAVAFGSKVSGDRFKFNGMIFTVADPTYINANVGMTMPKYKNSRFEIIYF